MESRTHSIQSFEIGSMSAAELIEEMLVELGEPELARRVCRKLASNDEAHLPVRIHPSCDCGSMGIDSFEYVSWMDGIWAMKAD